MSAPPETEGQVKPRRETDREPERGKKEREERAKE